MRAGMLSIEDSRIDSTPKGFLGQDPTGHDPDQDPADLVRPHEILGLRRDERDPVTIVNAARAKLRCIRDADGAERGVSRAVASLIVRARDRLLEQRFLGQ